MREESTHFDAKAHRSMNPARCRRPINRYDPPPPPPDPALVDILETGWNRVTPGTQESFCAEFTWDRVGSYQVWIDAVARSSGMTVDQASRTFSYALYSWFYGTKCG